MKYEVSDELLTQVKSELQISFDERDDSLRKAIKRGMAFITSRAGPVDFAGDRKSVV